MKETEAISEQASMKKKGRHQDCIIGCCCVNLDYHDDDGEVAVATVHVDAVYTTVMHQPLREKERMNEREHRRQDMNVL